MGRLCKLNRSLYGLKQAPRCWNIKFLNILNNLSLERSEADPCVLIRKREKKVVLILAIYVDDGLVAADSEEEVKVLLHDIRNFVEIKDGELEYYLGLEISKTECGIYIHQRNYAEKVLKKFGMEDCRPVDTPMTPAYPDLEGDEVLQGISGYREAVGSLIYLAVGTRPDLAFAVGFVSRYLDKPTDKIWQIVKRIFRYIKRTIDFGIFFSFESDFELFGYSDADYASDPSDRKSVTGYLFFLNGPVIWASKKQSSVALSTTESEYVAMSEATKEGIWLRRFLTELGLNLDCAPTKIFGDNQSAIRLIKNPEFHKKTKHIDTRYHFIREAFQKKLINPLYVVSADQGADILTKPLTKGKFTKLREKIGVTRHIK